VSGERWARLSLTPIGVYHLYVSIVC